MRRKTGTASGPPRAKRVGASSRSRSEPDTRKPLVHTEPVHDLDDAADGGDAAPAEAPRLDDLVSKRSVHSRRAVQDMIRSGGLMVDGIVVTEPGLRIQDTDMLQAQGTLRLNGEVLGRELPKVTYVVNKTRGTVSTRKDPGQRPTVMSLVPAPLRAMGLFPVGRLDQDTTGLLLLSSDGELTQHLTHPRHKIPKVYRVTVRGRMTPHQRYRLADGIELDGRVTQPALIESVRNDRDTTTFFMTITEGRNRQIRDMCQKIGLQLTTLHRVSVGPISLGSLRPGEWRELEPQELLDLRKALDSPPPVAPKRRDDPREPLRRDSRNAKPRRPGGQRPPKPGGGGRRPPKPGGGGRRPPKPGGGGRRKSPPRGNRGPSRGPQRPKS